MVRWRALVCFVPAFCTVLATPLPPEASNAVLLTANAHCVLCRSVLFTQLSSYVR